MSSAPVKGRKSGLRTRIVLYTSAVIGVTLAAAFLWSVYNLRIVLQDRNDAFLLRHESGMNSPEGHLPESSGDLPTNTKKIRWNLLRHEAATAGEDAGLLVLFQALTHSHGRLPGKLGDVQEISRQAARSRASSAAATHRRGPPELPQACEWFAAEISSSRSKKVDRHPGAAADGIGTDVGELQYAVGGRQRAVSGRGRIWVDCS